MANTNSATRRRTGAAKVNEIQQQVAAAAEQQQSEPSPFRNRIMAHQMASVDSLTANPDNWREHPKEQLEPLLGLLEDVGWVGEIMVNNRTGRMIDGHARVLIAERHGEKQVPISVVDLSPEEELKVLATYDYISGLAVRNNDKLRGLLAKIPESEQPVVNMMLADLKDVVGSGTVDPGKTGAKERANPFEHKAAAFDQQHGSDQSIMRNINVLIEKDKYDNVIAELNIVSKAYKTDNYSDAVLAAIGFTARMAVQNGSVDAPTGEVTPPATAQPATAPAATPEDAAVVPTFSFS